MLGWLGRDLLSAEVCSAWDVSLSSVDVCLDKIPLCWLPSRVNMFITPIQKNSLNRIPIFQLFSCWWWVSGWVSDSSNPLYVPRTVFHCFNTAFPPGTGHCQHLTIVLFRTARGKAASSRLCREQPDVFPQGSRVPWSSLRGGNGALPLEELPGLGSANRGWLLPNPWSVHKGSTGGVACVPCSLPGPALACAAPITWAVIKTWLAKLQLERRPGGQWLTAGRVTAGICQSRNKYGTWQRI